VLVGKVAYLLKYPPERTDDQGRDHAGSGGADDKRGTEGFDFERHWPRGHWRPRHGMLGLCIALARHLWQRGKRGRAAAAAGVAAGLILLGLWLCYLVVVWELHIYGHVASAP
jgi:hypothetical protein